MSTQSSNLQHCVRCGIYKHESKNKKCKLTWDRLGKKHEWISHNKSNDS
jgi:hypothetical protein